MEVNFPSNWLYRTFLLYGFCAKCWSSQAEPTTNRCFSQAFVVQGFPSSLPFEPNRTSCIKKTPYVFWDSTFAFHTLLPVKKYEVYAKHSVCGLNDLLWRNRDQHQWVCKRSASQFTLKLTKSMNNLWFVYFLDTAQSQSQSKLPMRKRSMLVPVRLFSYVLQKKTKNFQAEAR